MAEKYKGTLVQWDDAKGFGFIEPRLHGTKVFVHINDFVRKTPRPEVGQQLVYQLAYNDGKNRAVAVTLSSKVRTQLLKAESKAGPSVLSPIFTLLFCIALGVATWFDRVPQWLTFSFLLLSVFTFGLYALDKSAARAGNWRTSEATLLFAGLLGGWPGAVMAQHWLRHKTVKTSFRVQFWATVALHCCLLLLAYEKQFFGMSYRF